MRSFVIRFLISKVDMFDKVFNTDQWFAIEPEPKQTDTGSTPLCTISPGVVDSKVRHYSGGLELNETFTGGKLVTRRMK